MATAGTTQDVESAMCKLCAHITNMSTQLEVLQQKNIIETSEELSAGEAAKLHISLAYTLASLYYTLINSSGNNMSEHNNIMDEMERIKQYVAKISKMPAVKPSQIDRKAAKRMIDHHL